MDENGETAGVHRHSSTLELVGILDLSLLESGRVLFVALICGSPFPTCSAGWGCIG
jgi:hypothetical protein